RSTLEQHAGAKEADEAAEAVESVRRQLKEAHRTHQEELARLRTQIKEQRSEISELRRKVHHERRRAKDAMSRAEQVENQNTDRETEFTSLVNTLKVENRQLRSRLTSAEKQVETARKSVRPGRNADEERLRLLLAGV